MTTAKTIYMVSQWLNYAFAIPLMILGMVGSILIILIFIKQHSFWYHPTTIYLLAGAVMTAIHLPSVYLQSVLVDGFGFGVYNTNKTACHIFLYLLYVTTVSAISFPCWAAFDQYAGTCRHAAFRHRWSSIRVARLAIVGTVIFWAIIYLPVIFVSDIVNGLCMLKDGLYTKLNNYVLTPFVYIVVPVIVIDIFTQGTIRHLRSSRILRRHSRLTKQIRRMLIPQLTILAISGLPYGLESIYLESTRNVKKDPFRIAVEVLVLQILRLFYHVNFVSTFYIYLYMSSEIRKIVKQLMGQCFGYNNVVQTNTTRRSVTTVLTRSSVTTVLTRISVDHV
jgi:hypothetical protein